MSLQKPTGNTEPNNQLANRADVPDILKLALERQNLAGTPVEPEKLAIVAKLFRQLEHGYQSMVPLLCAGPTCPMAKRCPLLTNGFNYMVGEPCPWETHAIKVWTENYIAALQINPHDTVEVGLAADMAKMDIYALRIVSRLSIEDFVLDQVVAISDDGIPQYRKELHVAAQWEDLIERRKLKLKEALLATRKARAEAGAKMSSSDMATVLVQQRNMMDKLQKLQKEMQKEIDLKRVDDATFVPPESPDATQP